MSERSRVLLWRRIPRWLRRAILLTLATVIATVGAVLLVLPGPGVPLLFLSLTLLALEFTWAEVLLRRVRSEAARFTPKRLKRVEKDDKE